MRERPIISRLLSYFVRGLLFVAPVGFTILILYSGFDFIDSIVRIRFPGTEPNNEFFIPGLGFLIVITVTMVIGFTFSVLLPQTIQNLIENAISHLPLVRIFYFAFKDLISAFVGDKRKFDKPVVIQINKETGVYKVGFVTQSNLIDVPIDDLVAVYCPHSYAFSGEMFLVKRENISVLHISSAEVMKMIVSGGVSLSQKNEVSEE